MRLLQWRPRRTAAPVDRTVDVRFPAIGEFAGRARYMPGDPDMLPHDLRAAVGQVMEVEFAGIAPHGSLGGQSLYRECSGHNLFNGILIPERDLDFIP
jgi:hypothetical protein